MKSNKIIIIGILTACLWVCGGTASEAAERQGNLVFNAMETMKKNQNDYITNVNQIKEHRKVTQDRKEQFKKELSQAPRGSVREKELAAEFSKQVALNLKDTEKELQLTEGVSKEHALVLYNLIDQVSKTDGQIKDKQVEMVISTAKPVLANARSLFVSLEPYRSAIKDPELVEKLKQAAQTAETLGQYFVSLDQQGSSTASSKEVLLQKLKGLLEQFNGIHAQTGILLAQLGNDTDRLLIINQIATSEIIIGAISGGDAMAGTIGQEYLGDIKANMGELNNDINMLNKHVGAVSNAGIDGVGFPDWPELN